MEGEGGIFTSRARRGAAHTHTHAWSRGGRKDGGRRGDGSYRTVRHIGGSGPLFIGRSQRPREIIAPCPSRSPGSRCLHRLTALLFLLLRSLSSCLSVSLSHSYSLFLSLTLSLCLSVSLSASLYLLLSLSASLCICLYLSPATKGTSNAFCGASNWIAGPRELTQPARRGLATAPPTPHDSAAAAKATANASTIEQPRGRPPETGFDELVRP